MLLNRDGYRWIRILSWSEVAEQDNKGKYKCVTIYGPCASGREFSPIMVHNLSSVGTLVWWTT